MNELYHGWWLSQLKSPSLLITHFRVISHEFDLELFIESLDTDGV